jgi:hypothetical protein
MVGVLYVFNPVTSCGINMPLVVVVSGNVPTNAATGAQTLNFTGFTPPDSCIQLRAGLVSIVVGPPAPPSFEPPDPCVYTFRTLISTIAFTGGNDPHGGRHHNNNHNNYPSNLTFPYWSVWPVARQGQSYHNYVPYLILPNNRRCCR